MDFQTRYEFNPKIDLLGKGGFSKVYRARDTLLDRTVALKLFMATASEKYQVLSEIKKVIQFEHPNLCKYYDVAVINSQNIFGEVERTEVGIMEYLDAGDLKTYLKNHPQLVDKLLIDVLKGLSYLHKKGIVHRDLKPQNILVKMVDDEPVAKITDFGISKLISSEDNNSSALIGTIEYMAPEQFNPKRYGTGGRITTNLDLWSFGLLVYEAVYHGSLFGRRSEGTSAEQVMRNILSDSWLTKINALPSKYRVIVKKCLVKNAPDRVQHAAELIPLFSEDPIEEETIFVEKSKGPDEHINLVHEPDVHQPEQDDYELDTEVVEQPEQSAGTNLHIHDAEAETSAAHIPVQEPREEELNPDETRVIDHEEDPPDENTEVHQFGEEASTDNTALVDVKQQDGYDNETQIIQLEQEVAAENSEVLQLKQELPADANMADQSPGEQERPPAPVQSTGAKLIQTVPQHATAATSKKISGNKIAYYAVVFCLIVATVFLFRFFSKEKPKVAEKTIHQNKIAPRAEQSISITLPELIRVKGGDFLMGFKDSEATESELPAHQVHLSDFSIGKYEVTIDQFRNFINDTKYITTAEKEGTSDIYKNGHWQTGKSVNWRHDYSGDLQDSSIKNTPVIHVSWMDGNKYCEWLSKKTGKQYRLLTEAEWEFAARGGNMSKSFRYSGSNNIEDVAWYRTNAAEKIHRVGQKQPNELGIYDMSGNVMEWCNDWFDEDYYKKSNSINPPGPASGKVRAVRGGSSFLLDVIWFRNTYRAGLQPDVRGGQLGFRICRPEGSDSTLNKTGQSSEK